MTFGNIMRALLWMVVGLALAGRSAAAQTNGTVSPVPAEVRANWKLDDFYQRCVMAGSENFSAAFMILA